MDDFLTSTGWTMEYALEGTQFGLFDDTRLSERPPNIESDHEEQPNDQWEMAEAATPPQESRAQQIDDLDETEDLFRLGDFRGGGKKTRLGRKYKV